MTLNALIAWEQPEIIFKCSVPPSSHMNVLNTHANSSWHPPRNIPSWPGQTAGPCERSDLSDAPSLAVPNAVMSTLGNKQCT